MIKKAIYVGGVARSGTSWIGQIFNSCPTVRFRFQPMFSYEFRGKINEDSTEKEYQQFYNDLFETETLFLTQKDKVNSGVYPDFQKKGEDILVFKENRFQSFIEPMLRKSEILHFVGIIRNPCATLFSWTQNEKEFPPEADIMKEWRFANCKNKGNEDYFGYYKWKEVANLYVDLSIKYPERVHLIHYEKIIEDPEGTMKAIFETIGVPYSDQTINFLTKSAKGSDSNYYSVFKGNTNKSSWEENFPEYIISQIKQDLEDTRLETFLY